MQYAVYTYNVVLEYVHVYTCTGLIWPSSFFTSVPVQVWVALLQTSASLRVNWKTETKKTTMNHDKTTKFATDSFVSSPFSPHSCWCDVRHSMELRRVHQSASPTTPTPPPTRTVVVWVAARGSRERVNHPIEVSWPHEKRQHGNQYQLEQRSGMCWNWRCLWRSRCWLLLQILYLPLDGWVST